MRLATIHVPTKLTWGAPGSADPRALVSLRAACLLTLFACLIN